MLSGFLKHYGKRKFLDGVQSLNDAIVNFDPEGATEAAIAEMEANFDSINREFSKTKQEWRKEQDEADAIVAIYDKRVLVAENLSAQLETDPDNASVSSALTQLMDTLEGMANDVEREQEEAVDAKEVMNELEQTVTMYASKLKQARTDMKKAANTMQKAKRQEERATEKSNRARVAAGLSTSGSGLNSALESMNRQAADAQANADAETRKATLLNPIAVEDNDIIAKAMAEVSGESTGKLSPKERLAKLKNK